ncbi:Hsp33 family molecular chaperone HslO [Sneathiella sp. CAU 1612]|uniref:Hsp33 family molecular chaperone HslO n=1 Tax=Sneathiella sedimenti TaxID=2816034 RepID=A0ABS3F355_9PROT|nr:Hsp33 family molecular chaperone HslO [Sneathiella sedimenti]MBO0332945.1 Hsp33 family molecular chaperone HslO [Sneathiella sedimenti]
MAHDGQKIITDDLIQPFQMAKAGVRGRIVRMGNVVDSILKRHGYPDEVAKFLGEGIVLAAMLGGALKFDGIFTVQTKGDGAISMVAADMTTPGNMRGYASFEQEKLDLLTSGNTPMNVENYLGKGYAAFTIDAGEEHKRYQGIVDLEGENLADCMENYFDKSEQIDTLLRVAVEKVDGNWRAGGLMIQRLPDENATEFNQDREEENWRNAQALAGTITPEELTSPILKSAELLYKLFHEDGVWLYDPLQLVDQCSCSAERVMNTLKTFAGEDLEDMADDGVITADCQFCSSKYEIRVEDIS